MSEIKQLNRILEGVLFASQEPLSIKKLQAIFEEDDQPEAAQIKEALGELATHYEGRGIELKELGSGYQFQVVPDLSKWTQRLTEEKAPRFSRALLETLALIAYRQPITRGEIEEIRGVAVSSNIVRTLMDREWVRVVGYRDVPGKPALLASTKAFLDYFGLSKLDELPPLTELQDLEKAGEELEKQMQEEAEQAGPVAEEEQEAKPEREPTVSLEELEADLAMANQLSQVADEKVNAFMQGAEEQLEATEATDEPDQPGIIETEEEQEEERELEAEPMAEADTATEDTDEK